MTRTRWSRDEVGLARMFRYLDCIGKHNFKNPVPLTEVLNETSYVTRKGQRFFCTNCGWHKDVFG